MNQAYGELALQLSTIAAKREAYLVDIDFRESAQHAVHMFAAGAVEVAHTHSVVLIKPDAILSGQAEACVSMLREQGMRVVAARILSMTPHIIRSLWRYQLRYASIDRTLLLEDFFRLGPVLFLLAQDSRPRFDGVPFSVRLSAFKGTTTATKRHEGNLRSRLHSPNRLFSLLHTTDEPIDFLRELGVLFGRDDRKSLWQAMRDAVEVSDEQLRALLAAATRSEPIRLSADEFCVTRIGQLLGSGPGRAAYSAARDICQNEPGLHLPCVLLWFAERIHFNDEEFRFVKVFDRPNVDDWVARSAAAS